MLKERNWNRRYRRNRRYRKKRKNQLLVILFLAGILSISIIESTAHERETMNRKPIENMEDEQKDSKDEESNKQELKQEDSKQEYNKEDEPDIGENKNDIGENKNDIEENENDISENKNDIVKQENNTDVVRQENNKDIAEEENKKNEVPRKEKDSSVEKSDADEKDNFADAVFIGDSRTEGLQINTGLTTARFLAAKGLKVDTALSDSVIKLKTGSRGTVIDGLKEGTYNRVYLMFGMNELGWPYLDVFTNRYEQLIEEIKNVQPNATIYIQSIIPVTKEKSDKDSIYNNENISKFNKAIKDMADENGYIYVDVASAVMDSNSSLPSDASSDGVHLNKEYSQKWLDYLRETN